jgi:hypothetical protein
MFKTLQTQKPKLSRAAARPGIKAAHRAALARKHARLAARAQFRDRLAAATGNQLSTGRQHRGFWRDLAAYGNTKESPEAATEGAPEFLHNYFAKRNARRDRYRQMHPGYRGRRSSSPTLEAEQAPMLTQD